MDIYGYLHAHTIPYVEYEHPAVFTVAEADQVVRNVPGLRTKNLFLRDEHGKFYLVCMPGANRLNLKSLRTHLKVKELKFGTPEELLSELHLTPGSVSPLAMIYARNTRLVIDQRVWDSAEIGVHPNKNTATLVLSHDAFARFCSSLSVQYEVVSGV